MISFAHWIFAAALVPVAVSAAIIATGRLAERARPAVDMLRQAVSLFNLFYLAPSSLLHAISVPAVAIMAVAMTNALGGGLFRLPSSGWGLVPAIALYTLTMDFCEYVFHRAQHRFPVLWAMHSLHHSDRTLNVSTTQRHFWAEQAIKSATVYLAVGLLFRTNDRILIIYGVLSFWNFVSHMNLRLGFGPAWFILNSPQFHRVRSFLSPRALRPELRCLVHHLRCDLQYRPRAGPGGVPLNRPGGRGYAAQPDRGDVVADARVVAAGARGGQSGAGAMTAAPGPAFPSCVFRCCRPAWASCWLSAARSPPWRRSMWLSRPQPVVRRRRAYFYSASKPCLAPWPASGSALRIRPERSSCSVCLGLAFAVIVAVWVAGIDVLFPFYPSPMSTSFTSCAYAWLILCYAPSTRTFSTVFSCSPCWPGA